MFTEPTQTAKRRFKRAEDALLACDATDTVTVQKRQHEQGDGWTGTYEVTPTRGCTVIDTARAVNALDVANAHLKAHPELSAEADSNRIPVTVVVGDVEMQLER